MAMQFSSDSAEAMRLAPIAKDTDVRTPANELDEVYEIKRTADFIQQLQSRRVALQFPDELLVDSAAVAVKLEEATGSKMFVLGDTSYGSCCVDEVAAEHVLADALVHYGRACLSPSTRLPVLFVFGRKPVDVEGCAAAFRTLYPDLQSHVVVVSDVVYSYIIGACSHVGFPDEGPLDAELPDVSLITGELRSARLSRTDADPSCTALARRSDALTVAEISPAASFLDSRSWKGLEQKLGETPVTKAVQGRRGIAIAYDDEVSG